MRADVAGVSLSHPERLIYPELGISKLELARYFERISHWVVPHVKGRPLTLVHCPAGIAAPCRYLKHAKQWGPAALRRVRIREKTKVGEYLVADTAQAVVALVQMGIVEVHTWNSTDDDLERPNRIVWDLDPGPEVTWRQVASAARLLREVLETVNIRTWVKSTGGRGLHVVAPLAPRRDWTDCLAFAHAIGRMLERTDSLYTTAFGKAGREHKILIDYLRNNRTNTTICAYSPRARAGAPVSVPLSWRELATPPTRLTLRTVPRRLQRLTGDPWADYWTCTQVVAERAFRAVLRM